MEKWNLIQAFSGTQRHPHSFQRQKAAPFEVNKFASKITKGYSCVQSDLYSSCKVSVWKHAPSVEKFYFLDIHKAHM